MIVNRSGTNNFAQYSRYIGNIHFVDDDEEALKVLLDNYGNEEKRPFVITTDDYYTELLDNNYDKIVNRFFFFTCGESHRLTGFLNKDEQCRVAEECGFNVPKREVVKRGELPKTLNYPLITKSISSNVGGWKKDVHLCKSEIELKNAYDSILSETLLLEEYVEKECEITIQGISINSGEQVFIPFLSEDYDFSEAAFGYLMRYKPLRDSTLVDDAVKLIRAIRFTGLFGIDLARDNDNKLVFFEVNMRSDGKNYAATFGGVNLPYLWAWSTLNNTIPTDQVLAESFCAVNEVDEFNALRSHRLCWRKWIADVWNADLRFWYYRHDNSPLRHYIRYKQKKGLGKVSKLYRSITRDCWAIGFVENGLNAVMSNDRSLKISWLKHDYKDRWFADPFILDVTESEILLLVEEYRYETNKGRIAELVIDKDSCTLKEMNILLELDTHLSFPAIWRMENRIFVYPESWLSGSLNLYEYVGRGERLKQVKVLCDDTMSDAIITKRFGKELLLSTKENNCLRFYERKVGSERFTFSKEVRFGTATARNGGDFFEYADSVFRPAQVCDNCYGEAVEIQRVIKDSNENLVFEPCGRLYSSHPTLKTGLHTLNNYQDVTVIDVHGWVHPRIVGVIIFLKKLLFVNKWKKKKQSSQ